MTFRDLAQGAWRMRGIGVGQTLELLIPPEVADLIEKNARQSRSIGLGEKLFGRRQGYVDSEPFGEGVLINPTLLVTEGEFFFTFWVYCST